MICETANLVTATMKKSKDKKLMSFTITWIREVRFDSVALKLVFMRVYGYFQYKNFLTQWVKIF